MREDKVVVEMNSFEQRLLVGGLMEFKNILDYSPYSYVKKTDYPSVLFLSSDSDERVNPLHARKMTAAIQDATTSDNPVLLRIEKNAGHSGTGKVHSTIDREADTFSFLWEVLE